MAVGIYYFDQHRPRFPGNRRSPRREPLSGVLVWHTVEIAPDVHPPDDGAERAARSIANRSDAGSYHVVVDSDSAVALMPYDDEAAGDRTGTNRHAIHLSIATQAARWPTLPKWWRDGALGQLALRSAGAALHIARVRGRAYVPPAHRLTGDQARARTPGIVGHGDLDPGRRSDPGREFPWAEALAIYAYFLASNGIDPQAPSASIPASHIAHPLRLSPGDRGPEVAELQALVRFWVRPGLAVDGRFGDETAAAVEAFKDTLRVTAHDPSRVGRSPLWGFQAERAYGSFLSALSAYTGG